MRNNWKAIATSIVGLFIALSGWTISYVIDDLRGEIATINAGLSSDIDEVKSSVNKLSDNQVAYGVLISSIATKQEAQGEDIAHLVDEVQEVRAALSPGRMYDSE